MVGSDAGRKAILEGPTVVLVEPQLGDNIGFAARAMLNGGLTELRLVRPRDGWPNPRAEAAAAGADLVIENARLFATAEEAVADLNHVFATTARRRDMVKPVMTPRRAAAEMRRAVARGERVGILFGGERSGLANDDVALADTLIRVPLNPEFSSLNLGHAVMILAYEWFQAGDATPDERLVAGRGRLATKAELANFFRRLEGALDARGFFHVREKRPAMVRNIRSIFQRARLTDHEVGTLHGIVTALMRAPRARRDGDTPE